MGWLRLQPLGCGIWCALADDTVIINVNAGMRCLPEEVIAMAANDSGGLDEMHLRPGDSIELTTVHGYWLALYVIAGEPPPLGSAAERLAAAGQAARAAAGLQPVQPVAPVAPPPPPPPRRLPPDYWDVPVPPHGAL